LKIKIAFKTLGSYTLLKAAKLGVGALHGLTPKPFIGGLAPLALPLPPTILLPQSLNDCSLMFKAEKKVYPAPKPEGWPPGPGPTNWDS